MKVLHVLDHSIPLHSGYTFRTRSILKQQHALGIETCHVTSPKHGNVEEEIEEVDGLTFYRSAKPAGVLSKLPVLNQLSFVSPMEKRILDVIEKENPDIIHAHSPALNGLAALKAAKKKGIPVVYEIRAFWEDAAVDHGTCKEGDLRYKMTRSLESHVVKHADAVTTICQGLKNDLIGRGVADSKLTVIPNAVNVEQFEKISEKDIEMVEQLNLEGKQVLGFIGSFYAYEGLDLLVKAMPQIIKQMPNAFLLLVGGGPQEANLKAQVNQLGLQDRVRFTGRVPHSEVGKYYSLVDLLVYPRKSMRLTELVTPLKPLEAMAQTRLFLASDVGGHHELITDNETGFLFKAGDVDALVRKVFDIFNREAAWPVLRENGRNYVENVRNWKNSVSNYLPVYQRLAKKTVQND
ncbi:TIGR04063 family PEP-CTERM/XrtA system glycosyltransferase [Thalassotalea euphylliae]|uniref:TIGR04063 family PEP-CTERM/XrtA system glycosyltransferase n=1 Tax=Thalassotalea euphylliae TaxID=1655234 RepID=UPI003630E3AE